MSELLDQLDEHRHNAEILREMQTADREARDHAARLVRETTDKTGFRGNRMVRMALEIAARAIERGRHLTDAERLHNLASALEEDDAVSVTETVTEPKSQVDDRPFAARKGLWGPRS